VLFSVLRSGFNIAMKDLEIRGAGDILGGEQSGFINDIGFDTYQKILAEAIDELKEKEFAELYQEELNKPKVYVKDAQIDTDFELLFPDDYINNISERLNLYNELSNIKEDTALTAFEKRLVDRFGPLPTEAKDLLDSVKIKWIAASLGLEKIILKQQRVVGYFIGDQQSSFYQTALFGNLLRYVQSNPNKLILKEKETRNGLRLLITFQHMDSISKVLSAFEQLIDNVRTNPIV
jgi:transcription-repair coupling factor (superfamily II helicase)